MKVYITQGHEQGIGLEVFFKSALLSSANDLCKMTLVAFPKSVRATLDSMKMPYELQKDKIVFGGVTLTVEWLTKIHHSQSLTALNLGMKLAEVGGVLFTLPTSKDQFLKHPGHTEYFRGFYKRPELGMFFSSPGLQVLLLSDHVPLKNISEMMTTDLIYSRLKESIKTLTSWKWPIQRILVSGFNPHAGENGLIGNEDARVNAAIKRLAPALQIEMSGPFPGDTMLLEQSGAKDLLVYVYHDQGLGVFKGLQGFIGSNITLGLPYPRVSPDHGTSFKLFGKNQADYRGCAHSLREALMLSERIQYGKDSGHKGKGTQP